MASRSTTHTACHLSAGERILCQGAPSLWANGFWILISIILLPGSGVWTVIGLTILAAVWWNRRSKEITITNKRLITKTGFIFKKAAEMQLADVENIQVQQGVFGHFLDFGTIKISCEGKQAISVAKISSPMRFRRAFVLQQGAKESASAPAQPAQPAQPASFTPPRPSTAPKPTPPKPATSPAPVFVKVTLTDPTPIPPPTAKTQTDKDAWGGTLYDEPSVHHLAMPVLLHYTDQNGQASKRQVDITAYSPHQGGMVYGRCHLRNANRTFRFDRIQKAIDQETGEIIPDLLEELETRWAASPEASIDRLLEDYAPVLKMLLYTAKADGSMRAAELNVITSMAADITQDNRLTPSMLKSAMESIVVPTITSFTRIYNALRRSDPVIAEKSATACRAIIATQKTVHPNEQAVLDVLNTTLPRTRQHPP